MVAALLPIIRTVTNRLRSDACRWCRNRAAILVVLVATVCLLAAGEARAEELVADDANAFTEKTDGFGFGGLPILSVNSDDGFGYGGIGRLYERNPDDPRRYAWAVTAQVFLTTRSIQAHGLTADIVDVADLPLRLYTRVGWYSTQTQSFCGFGGTTTCSDKEAQSAADARSVPLGERERFLDRFYQLRYVEPFGEARVRWRLLDKPVRTSLLAGWRGSGYIPGVLGDQDPYVGSFYATEFPNGESGLVSLVTGGIVFDHRNKEPDPTEGWFAEASIRDSSPAYGSAWSFSGANVTGRFYFPIGTPRLVSATRLVADVMWGSPPTMELPRVGGTQGYEAFGGQSFGRGLRAWRGLGKVKGMGQTELRYRFYDTELFDQNIGVSSVAFVDAGVIAVDLDTLGDAGTGGLVGTGGGLRVAWNRHFVVRFDSGVSPSEDWIPRVYLGIDNLF